MHMNDIIQTLLELGHYPEQDGNRITVKVKRDQVHLVVEYPTNPARRST